MVKASGKEIVLIGVTITVTANVNELADMIRACNTSAAYNRDFVVHYFYNQIFQVVKRNEKATVSSRSLGAFSLVSA